MWVDRVQAIVILVEGQAEHNRVLTLVEGEPSEWPLISDEYKG